MRLTTFTDYSLRVLMHLAARPAQRATIAQIAGDFAISEHHLVKVVHFLGHAGLVRTLRGKGGGLQLARPAAQIGVGEVVRAAEGPSAVVACFEARATDCTIAPACRLRGVLAEAVQAFEAVLDRYTLADLVRQRSELAPLIFMVTRSRAENAVAPPRTR